MNKYSKKSRKISKKKSMKTPIKKSSKKMKQKSIKKLSRKFSKKLERCILDVKSKLSDKNMLIKCKDQKWKGQVKGKKCYNPWAVCRASINKSL